MAHHNKKTPVALIIGAAMTAATALGVGLLYYLKSGSAEADASLIPNSIEQRLDRLVETLNQRFGKQWVTEALGTLQAGLEKILPAPLVALVEVVHRVEKKGQEAGWSGSQKLHQAAAMARA